MITALLALAAVIAFIIGLFIYGSVHGFVFWLLLGLALTAAALLAPIVDARTTRRAP